MAKPMSAHTPPVSPVAEAPPAQDVRQPRLCFEGAVVAIGASAGGLEALERLFEALPANTGAAFVVIQHLSPDHKSMMDNLLARYTAMPVCVASHDMPLAPNSVFLIPPAKCMRLSGDRLLLSPKPDHGLSLPIDMFFSSMAEQCADRGIAVVLSGTGSDGSRGIPAVNAAGGFVFVQEPGSAKFDGMPRSAIGTGLADVVAPAPELARRLAEHLKAPRQLSVRLPSAVTSPSVAQPLEGILELLLSSSGIDFHDYKPNTVVRRIERRMQVRQVASMQGYLEQLEASSDEQAVLRRELLIPVTRFFRDPEVFANLAEQVIGPLVAHGRPDETIRVWVACCATGEEAYSIAMLLAEAMQEQNRLRPVKIFATDVEQHYLDVASAGVYPGTIAAEVSGDRLQRWFIERDGGWSIRPEIRQMVVFARHNIVADPPFTRMHLVSCRNALIYLQPGAQEGAMRRLQYALAPGGHLMLGPSESLGVLHLDFEPLVGRGKVYRLERHDRVGRYIDMNSRHHALPFLAARSPRVAAQSPPAATALVGEGERLLQRAYLPPSLLVGPSRELLHVFGNARELLQVGEGQMSLDVLKLLPRELAWPAGLLIQAVSAEACTERSAPVQLGHGDEARRMRLVARRVPAPDGAGKADPAACTLLSFELLDVPDQPDIRTTELDEEQRKRVDVLERELDLMHQNLQATIEELETTNEELQASNEELMASNEELQSTNEELQSVNEELYTVNSEFQEKVDVLNSVNADLENIAKATATPTLFMDEHLRLLRFTPELMQLFKVRESDRGRSLEDFSNTLHYPELFDDLRATLAERTVREREVRSRDGQWWLTRIQPYSARKPDTDRAVMSFVNVTSLKDSQRLQALIDSLAEHLTVLDMQGNIVMVNAAWRRFAAEGGDPDLRHSGPGTNYLRVCASAALVDPDARTSHDGLSAVLSGRLPRFSMKYPCQVADRTRWFFMQAEPLAYAGGGAVVSHTEITAWLERAGSSVPVKEPLA